MTCKQCGVDRDTYTRMLSQEGKIVELLDVDKKKPWWGKYCYKCVLERKKIRERISYNKRPLQELECVNCGLIYKQRSIHQKFCYAFCKADFRKKSRELI